MTCISDPTRALMLGILFLEVACGGCATTGRPGVQTMELAAQLPLRLGRIDRQRRAGRLDDAIAAYRALLDEISDAPLDRARVWHELGVTYGQRAEKDEGSPSSDDRREALRCALRAAELADGAPEAPPVDLTAAIRLTLGRCHRLVGRIDQAIGVYQNLLDRLPDDRVERIRTLHELGNAYLQRAGRRDDRPATGTSFREDLDAALVRQTDALDLTARVESCPRYLIAWIHNSLGLIGRRESRLEDAIEHFGQAEEIFGETTHRLQTGAILDVDQQVPTLQNLIQTLLDAGRYDPVEVQCKRLSELPSVKRNPRAMVTLGVAELSLGRFGEAAARFDLARFVARQQPRFAEDADLMAELSANAALCAQVAGDFVRAEELLTEAHEGLAAAHRLQTNATHGTGATYGNPGTAAVIEANLGRMYLTLGKLEQAEDQLQAAYDRQKDLYGEQHPDTLLTLLDLAALARERARYGEAESLCQTALTGLEAALGPEHPSVGGAQMALAAALNDRGRCEQAGEHAARAISIFDAALGRNHKRSIEAVLRATLFAATCQDTSEGAMRFRSLRADAGHRFEQLRQTLGPKHVDVLRAMVLFADINARTPEAHAKALEIYQAAEAGFLEAFGDRHSSLAKLRWGQARLLAEMGRADQAFAVYTNALNRLDPSFDRHPLRAWLLEGLGDLLQAKGEVQQARRNYQQAHRILIATYGSAHPAVKAFIARHGG